MPRHPPRSDPGGPDGDRNGEPSESDWGCLFIVVMIISIFMIIVFAVLGATITDGGPWWSE